MKLLVWISILLFPYFQKGEVMICVSGTAYSYHKAKCQGLRECTHEIKWITLKLTADGIRTINKRGLLNVVKELRAQGQHI